MKYIFPKNYNFKNKIFGVIDYSTAIFNVVTFFFIFSAVNTFIKSMSVKFILLIILYLPVLLFSVVGFNNENVLYIFFYIFKFLVKPKVYVYK